MKKWTSLMLAALSVFHISAFADLPQLDSALENYMDNPASPRALNQVRHALQGLENQGIPTQLGNVLSQDDRVLKKNIDHYIQVAENSSANGPSLRKIGACFFVGAVLAVGGGCLISNTAIKGGNSGYAVDVLDSGAVATR